MNEKSTVEAVAGNVVLNIAANAATILPQVFPSIGAQIGATTVPLLSAVPFLLQTLAAGRQSARIDESIRSLATEIADLKCDIRDITDDQYKLASECSLAFLSTIHQAKLDMLRKAIINSLVEPSISDGVSEALGRLIRDISVQEAALVVELFQYRGILIVNKPGAVADDCHAIMQGTPEELAVGGLIRLGLLYATTAAWDSTRYGWSPITAKLIALLQARTS